MEHNHAMIDLETLGLSLVTAPMLQFGASIFRPRVPGVSGVWSTRASVSSNERIGRTIEPATEKFWKDQDPELYKLLKSGTDDVVNALASLATFLQTNNVAEVWSNGSGFDIAMLQIAYESIGVKLPWNFRLVRDTRTLWALAADRCPRFLERTEELQQTLGWMPLQEERVKHDALSDCLSQTLTVQMAYAILDMDRKDAEKLFAC